MRPGCDRPAVARLAYDAVQCRLWLEALPQHAAPVQELCAFHVERLTVPRGWTVIDRREPDELVEPGPRSEVAAPSVEPVAPPVEPAAPPVEPVARSVEPAAAPVEPVSAPEPAATPEVAAPSVEPAAAVASPVPQERPTRRRKPAGPLLERAFALTSEQRSVLTQGDDADRD